MSAVTQLLREVAWGELDCLVVDMPPGTGDVQLTMAQSAPLAGAIIVSTPQDLALIDARRGIAMFEKVGFPCRDHREHELFHLSALRGPQRHFRAWRRAPRGGKAGRRVPRRGAARSSIRETSDAGRPVVAAAPDGPHAEVFRAIARAVIGRLDAPAQRAAPKS